MIQSFNAPVIDCLTMITKIMMVNLSLFFSISVIVFTHRKKKKKKTGFVIVKGEMKGSK